jgi:hypothetical protein
MISLSIRRRQERSAIAASGVCFDLALGARERCTSNVVGGLSGRLRLRAEFCHAKRTCPDGAWRCIRPAAERIGNVYIQARPTKSMPGRRLFPRVRQEETGHLSAGVGSARVRVGAAGAAAGPSMARAVQDPLLKDLSASGVQLDRAGVG